MALRGSFSQSFLRSKDLLSYSEISYDKEGNYIHHKTILKEALARNQDGKLIRNKVNIAKILNKYGILYRMIFNTMNMEQYTYNEIQEALNHLSEYINDLGVSGIIEFHAADKTQNSDHIHFWISTEDKIIYNKIAKEMVAMGYSNKEDVYIQKYEDNYKINESEYVNTNNYPLKDRFQIKPMGMEAGKTIESIHDMLSIKKNSQNSFNDSKFIKQGFSNVIEEYNKTSMNINKIIKESLSNPIKENNSIKNTKETTILNSINLNCSLPKIEETNSILKRIKQLKEDLIKK
jgi:hypothetical protein